MRTVVLGGAGFLGSHLCDRFLSEGHEIVCVDSLLTSARNNVSHCFDNPHFSFVQCDISKDIPVSDTVDLILHFASPASPKDYLSYPLETLAAGSSGTLNSLRLAHEKKARFILASTSEVYGDPTITPQNEDYWGNVNPVGPRSVYDEAKRFAEALTMAHHRKLGVNVGIIRIFNTYGPRMRAGDGRVIPTFVNQALRSEPLTVFGDGSQTRSYCFVSDLVDGIYRMAMSQQTGPVNLGNPVEEYSVLDVARLIVSLVGSRSTIAHKGLPQDDPKVRRPDITRARKLLGWEPKISLEHGVRMTIDYFRSLPQQVR